MNFRSIVHHIDSLPPLSDTMQVVRKLYQAGPENVANVFTDDSINDAAEIVSDMGLDVEQFKTVYVKMKETYLEKNA